jgi:hypothetical protein
MGSAFFNEVPDVAGCRHPLYQTGQTCIFLGGLRGADVGRIAVN